MRHLLPYSTCMMDGRSTNIKTTSIIIQYVLYLLLVCLSLFSPLKPLRHTMTENQDSGEGRPPAADAMEDDNGSTTTNEVDLSVLDTWIAQDEEDAEVKPSFEQMLRRCQRTHIQKLTSREAVQARLKTFRPLTYFCKPASLSPLVCARFGCVQRFVTSYRGWSQMLFVLYCIVL
jgi:C3HC zinc finger-like